MSEKMADARGRLWWYKPEYSGFTVFCDGATIADYKTEKGARDRVAKQTSASFETIKFDAY